MAPSTVRSSCTSEALGSVLVVYAALSFGFQHLIAKALYLRGFSVLSLCFFRSLALYLMNAIFAALAAGGSARAGWAVLTLRVDRRRDLVLALCRGFAGATGYLLLNLSFLFLTLADAFTLFLGIGALATIGLSRCVFDRNEALGPWEWVSGCLVFAGVVLVAQPPLLFGGEHRASAAGFAIIGAGAFLNNGVFNVLTRALGSADHPTPLSPSLLLSAYMLCLFVSSTVVALAARWSRLVYIDGFEWTHLTPPTTDECGMLAVYALGGLSGQLANAAGYARTRASIAVILALSELGFVYVLSVTVLHETTNALSLAGTALVFVSVCALAVGQGRPRQAQLASADTGRGAVDEEARRLLDDEARVSAPFHQPRSVGDDPFDQELLRGAVSDGGLAADSGGSKHGLTNTNASSAPVARRVPMRGQAQAGQLPKVLV